jgi:long-chain acyl-CoA synthetase
MRSALVTQPTGSSLQRLAEASWQRIGDASTLIFEEQRCSSGLLAERTRRVAHGLVEAGLQPGDRVVLCMANGPEVGICYNAVWRSGAVTTPVLFLLTEEELHHVLVDSEASFVITTPEFLPKVQAAAVGVETLRGVILAGGSAVGAVSLSELEAADEGVLVDRDPSDMAALLYTGGTTGRSKGVILCHDAMSSASWAAVAASYREDISVSLSPLPLSHAYGLLVSTLSLHAPNPGTSILMRWFDPIGWLELAQKHGVQTGAVVPSMLQMLLAHPIEDFDLSRLARINSGAAPLLSETRAEFERRVPQCELAEGYGCTENSALISSTPIGGVRPGSVGQPVPGVDIRLEMVEGSDAEVGQDGEICVRGTLMMTGYWHAPQETNYALRGGWLHTGDVGRLDADGYLYVVDRLKDLIIRGGINIYPRDVEDVLLSHPDVVASAVVGKPDPKYGEEVVAFVQLRPGAGVIPADLVEFAKEHISAAKYPREVRIVDAIPLTSVLKTDRKALRALVNG